MCPPENYGFQHNTFSTSIVYKTEINYQFITFLGLNYQYIFDQYCNTLILVIPINEGIEPKNAYHQSKHMLKVNLIDNLYWCLNGVFPLLFTA